MQVALYGATGRAGSRILQELLQRGHRVVAITREQQQNIQAAQTQWRVDDLSSVNGITAAIAGTEAVVSAYAPPPDATDQLIGVCERLAQAVQLAPPKRLLVAGGAGVLQVAPGITLLQSGKLPSAWVSIASSHAKALAALRKTSANWTYLSPAALFEPGPRTGRYRISEDALLINDAGESRISMEDYAIAMVDELEVPQHHRGSFAVGW
jgi:uncharacterized protein